MNKTKSEQSKEKQTKRKFSQVIGCRVTPEQWMQFERKCIENQQTMTDVMRKAVLNFLN